MLFLWKQLCDFCCLSNLLNFCSFPWPEFSICLFILDITCHPLCSQSSIGAGFCRFIPARTRLACIVLGLHKMAAKEISFTAKYSREFEVSPPENLPAALSIQESTGECSLEGMLADYLVNNYQWLWFLKMLEVVVFSDYLGTPRKVYYCQIHVSSNSTGPAQTEANCLVSLLTPPVANFRLLLSYFFTWMASLSQMT